MKDKFINYLDEIEKLKKNKEHDKAWKIANKGLLYLDDMWFMMYYQMADILAREKKWVDALEKMSFVIYFLGGLGGVGHEKFVLRLLKKIGKEDKFNEYINLSKSTKPEEDIRESLKKLLDI